MLWNMRCEKVTSSDLRKTDIRAKPQMSPPPSPNPPSLATISSSWNLNNKRRQEPFSHQKKVKRSTFLVRFFWKRSHLKAICLHWNPACHCYRELSLQCASADGDRQPSSAAFTSPPWCLGGLLNSLFRLRSAETYSSRARSVFFITDRCHLNLRKKKKKPFNLE